MESLHEKFVVCFIKWSKPIWGQIKKIWFLEPEFEGK